MFAPVNAHCTRIYTRTNIHIIHMYELTNNPTPHPVDTRKIPPTTPNAPTLPPIFICSIYNACTYRYAMRSCVVFCVLCTLFVMWRTRNAWHTSHRCAQTHNNNTFAGNILYRT